MKTSILLLGAAASSVLANPGMSHLMRGLARRQAGGPPVQNLPLIGDLLTKGATTPVGTEVLTCLQDASGASCENNAPKTYVAPALDSPECAKDTCCVWDFVSKELVEKFTSSDGTCNDLARAAVRLGFHDAGAWSQSTGPGGADGSLLLNTDEIARAENNGLQDIRSYGLSLLTKYAAWGVGAADLVQFMHNIAVVVCPLGPRQLTFVGRDSSALIPPHGLLPDTRAPVTTLLDLFVNKTIGTVDLISLIGAHTTATQRFVDPSQAGAPLDTTDGIWDVAFYAETLVPAAVPGTFRLPSDQAFSTDNRTGHGFVTFSDPATGQQVWNAFYSKAYLRLSLLGVDKINELTDCTKVLPDQQPAFVPKKNTVSSSSAPAYYPTSTAYSTSTIWGTKTITITKEGKVTWSKTVVPVSTTLCPIEKYTSSVPKAPIYYSASSSAAHVYNLPVSSSSSAVPVYNLPVSSSSIAAKPYPVKTSTPAVGYAYPTGTGAYNAPAQFTGAANKNSLGLAAIVGAAAVAMF